MSTCRLASPARRARNGSSTRRSMSGSVAERFA
jgi:hypothetical protein